MKAPQGKGTRPATDRVREAVFSAIGAWVEDADVADLYAGSGSFGLEALSRGAAGVVFVEKARQALTALRANVVAVGLGGEVVDSDVDSYLAKTTQRFHLMFIDPPWDMPTERLERQLHELDRLLRPEGEVVLSRRWGDREPIVPETWRVATDKRYGDTRILRYEKVEESDDRPVPR